MIAIVSLSSHPLGIKGKSPRGGLRSLSFYHTCKAMDLIFAVASIIGLVGAATKIPETHFKVMNSVNIASRLASNNLREVSDVSACLYRLRTCLMGSETTPKSYENLPMVEQIIVFLSNCV